MVEVCVEIEVEVETRTTTLGATAAAEGEEAAVAEVLGAMTAEEEEGGWALLLARSVVGVG